MSTDTETIKPEVETEGEKVASAVYSLADAVNNREGSSLASMVEVLAQSVAGDLIGDNLTASLGRLADVHERNVSATYAFAEAIREGFSELANAIREAKKI